MNENNLKFKKYSIIGLVFAFGLSIASYSIGGWASVHTGALLFLASLNTWFFSILIFNQYRLRCKADEEKSEQETIRKSHGASKELFDESDEALMLASRALSTWKRYVLPVFTLVYGLTVVIFMVFWWLQLKEPFVVDGKLKMAAAACTVAVGVCYFLLGAFFSGASRQQGGILLRPFSEWCYLTSVICAALVTVLLLGDKSYPYLDLYTAKVILAVFIFLAFELSVNFLIDWYRPRFHKEEKSILESRFLAVFTDSGSIASNIAHALDYQFGLKVTDAAFYKFVRKTLVPLLIIQLSTLYLLSCFTLVEIGERGLKESFGKIDEKQELAPRLYVHLPWPFTKVHVFPADRIMSVEVGQMPAAPAAAEEEPYAGNETVTVTEDVILWKKSGHHTKGMEEIKYVISNNVAKDDSTSKKASTEYNMITVVVPIHFKIKSWKEGEVSPLYQYMIGHADGSEMLKSVASSVVVEYLSKSDYFEFLGKNRVKAEDELRGLVQQEADRMQLGVEIVLIALHSTHPPGDVATDYDDFMAAEYDRDKYRSEARVQSVREKSSASITAAKIKSEADAEVALIEIDYWTQTTM